MTKMITLITGTRKGIGRYLAEYYIQQGHIVIGCSRNNLDKTDRLENYTHFAADIADEKAVKKVFAYINHQFGKLDIIINNAGIASMNSLFLTPLETVRQILQTNIIGSFLFCREAAKIMIKHNFGRIINFTTVAAPLKLEGEAVYAASKAAILSLTQILARELAPWNITVNAVGPTPIDTDLIRHVPADKMTALLQRQAIARKGNLNDVANVIDFFLKKDSNFITGQNIYLGGI